MSHRRSIGWTPGLVGATVAATLAVASAPSVHAPDLSRSRGPNGSCVAETTGLPVEVGPARNVVWKTPLPAGSSSPILGGDRIFLTGFEGNDLLTLCLDRKTGAVLWKKVAPRDRTEKIDKR